MWNIFIWNIDRILSRATISSEIQLCNNDKEAVVNNTKSPRLEPRHQID